MTQNSIEKQYKKLNDDIVCKLDDIVNDLEKELINKVKKSYPKYSNSIQLNSNQSNNVSGLTFLFFINLILN